MKARPLFELEINQRKVRLGERTLIMGVLNVTPDSFSDGGRYFARERAIAHGLELARQGADWIDVGGESTRPGARAVTAAEELDRVRPVIRGLRRKLRSMPISIDTTKAEVADQALRAGANIINDVSGLRFDSHMAEVARRHGCPLILMHIRGRPETMQQRPFVRYIWRSLFNGLAWSIRRALAAGIRRSQLILDPGFGFGKTRRQNYEILAHLERLRRYGLPLLVGSSRKSFIQAVVAGEGLESLRPRARRAGHGPLIHPAGAQPAAPLQVADAAAVVAAILAGAHIVRVHDVAAMLAGVRIADSLRTASLGCKL
jgi:dihydropteroate synthase